MATLPDNDPQETKEWLDALESVLENEGAERVHFLLDRLIDKARSAGACVPFSATTPYCNTIPLEKEQRSGGNHFEVSRFYIVVAALKALADDGAIKVGEVSKAIRLYQINPDKPNPATV